ncbi:MAG: ABC transporter ATP-binding protein [Nitrosopumilaceae archaeon]|jgi:peptide/nickel transport system ATP-binding protein|uniref:ABC transporter ATP-binding protein n=3 Tax=Candidatus Nitrosomaritimum aestuariumsis TaxID=3342354 RepID=A0AC60VWJ6_9ARCH|nr:ABC transporter ATP-binding protein [Nitrosopumilaceae archaeon]MBA4453333.1 ABC transporter ATP-binding protein [Nitrosopumilaceae archaeon]MBA4459434.1 ABC transporter ATP-binding protein [Nitrosopumilaceae archaeon]MBA4462327.1 ABC transporter ATP-binding protein [Nitrosopumilaceae archaeon]MBA4464290.1 ABC transporter ATP-binding protein [Nitrosopumilaceae archaeon]
MKLSVKDLTARYSSSNGPVYAVEDVDFDLEDGQSIGIAGESACGKSTLGLSIIRMLSGGKVQGKIVLGDDSILDLSESDFDKKFRWKKISMVFQGAMNTLDPVFTIKDQFIEVLKQHDFDGDIQKTIEDAMHSVSLDSSVLKRYPHELSGGMKQRVVIAMALLLKPRFVIADEPTTALDVLIQAQIVNLLKDLKKQGMSFMLITHDLAILSEIADKIGIMYAGQMVEFGSSYDIYKNPKHPYTQGLLKSIPTLHGDKPSYIKGNPPSLLEPPTECRFIERCPLAIDKCKNLPPKIKTKTGYVQCWLYEDEELT